MQPLHTDDRQVPRVNLDLVRLLRDLRAPLAMLVKAARGQDAVPPEQLEEIDAELQRALALHGLRGGLVDIDVSAVDLAELVEAVIESSSSTQRTRIGYRAEGPTFVIGDRVRASIAIANLLSAALAYASPSSTVTVWLSESSIGATLSVVVPDANRLQPAALGVARRIVEAHRGSVASIQLRDALLWCLEFPLSPRRNVGTQHSILVVDDSVEQGTALAEVLRGDGMDVYVATSGQQALSRIAETAPDLLIVDFQLGDMIGVDVIQRAREARAELPAVLVSGYPADHPLIADALRSTGSMYVGKPVSVDALLQIVTRTLSS